jgi:hypothetical protein
MALPTTDPRVIPEIDSLSTPGPYTFDGRGYSHMVLGSGLSIFLKPRAVILGPPVTYDIADSVYFVFDKTDFYVKEGFYMLATEPSAVGIEQPLTYLQRSVACIIYSYSRWKAGISTDDIDDASFTLVDTWGVGNDFLFSPSFIGDSSLQIIRGLCEASAMVYLYVNGGGKLACGYLDHQPTAPDWTLDEGDIISIKSYGEMLDRDMPGVVRYGWDGRGIQPGAPKFGWAKADMISEALPPEGTVLDGEYEAKYIDHGSDWPGSYVDFGDFMRLEVEVGPRASAWDIDEVVRVNNTPLGLSIDPDFPDYFRIHKIRYHLRTMTATVTMVKKKTWNAI